jgi:hypothetical protein
LRSDGLMVVPIAAGANRIDVRWQRTADQWAGIALSLAALAITLSLAWRERRSQEPSNQESGNQEPSNQESGSRESGSQGEVSIR